MYISHEIQNKFPLSHKKPFKKAMRKTMLIVGIASVVAISLEASLADFKFWHLALIIPFFMIFYALVYFYETWYYKNYFYDLTDDYVIIKKGPIAPQEITIPYDRIQDVYLDQDLLDRVLGLYDVHLSTATVVSGMRAHIDGVDRNAAHGLREIILKKMKEKHSK